MWNLKKDTNYLIYKKEAELQTSKRNTLPKGNSGGQERLSTHTLLYIKQKPNEDLLHTTGNSRQQSVIHI